MEQKIYEDIVKGMIYDVEAQDKKVVDIDE